MKSKFGRARTKKVEEVTKRVVQVPKQRQNCSLGCLLLQESEESTLHTTAKMQKKRVQQCIRSCNKTLKLLSLLSSFSLILFFKTLVHVLCIYVLLQLPTQMFICLLFIFKFCYHVSINAFPSKSGIHIYSLLFLQEQAQLKIYKASTSIFSTRVTKKILTKNRKNSKKESIYWPMNSFNMFFAKWQIFLVIKILLFN